MPSYFVIVIVVCFSVVDFQKALNHDSLGSVLRGAMGEETRSLFLDGSCVVDAVVGVVGVGVGVGVGVNVVSMMDGWMES